MEKSIVNIAVIGKSGVGKSSFCNYIFNADIFATGKGKPVTGWKDHFVSHAVDHDEFTLNIYDSVGLEPNNLTKWNSTLEDFWKNSGPSSNNTPMEWIHAVIYLINAASARVEDTELQILGSIAKKGIPLQVVLTNCDSATEEQTMRVKQAISNKFGLLTITEVCSVTIKKRSGVTEPFGKSQTIDELLGKLDAELRGQFINYACDQYCKAICDAKSHIINQIDESQIGLFNIIKAAIQHGDSFDVEDLFDVDLDLDEVGDVAIQALEGLDAFLMDLGFVSKNGLSSEAINEINEKIMVEVESIGVRMEEYLNGYTEAFDGDSSWEKAKAVVRFAGIMVDIKGFIKKVLNETFESILNFIQKQKLGF